MRYLLLISALFLVTSSCTQNAGSTASPLEPEFIFSSTGLAEECHWKMLLISFAATMHFASNGTYPADMNELGSPYNQWTCPECALPYELYGDQAGFVLYCPLQPSPGHGSVINGKGTWTSDPLSYQKACRNWMRTIASQEVIFFACNGKYTGNLEDLEMSGLVCPQCGETYVLQVSGEGDEFFVGCPAHHWANHGNIDNGISSWLDTEATEE